MLANAIQRAHRAAFILTMALAAVTAVRAAGRPPDPVAAFSLPARQSDFALSPNGRILAWRQRRGAQADIVIYDLATKTLLPALGLDRSLRLSGLYWQDNRTLLVDSAATQGNARDQPFARDRLLAVNVANGKVHRLLRHGRGTAMVFNARLLLWDIPGRPHTVVISTDLYHEDDHFTGFGGHAHGARANPHWALTLFTADTRTGDGTLLAAGDAFTYQWVVDRSGEPVARAEWRGKEHRYLILARSGTGWRRIYARSDGVRPMLWGLDGSGRAILATVAQHGRQALWSIPLDGSPPKRVLPGENVLSVGLTAYTRKPAVVRVAGSPAQLIWRDRAAQDRYQSVVRAFPGREVRIEGYSRDGSRVLALVQGPSEPPRDYLINFTAHRAGIVGEKYPPLDRITLGRVESIRYRTGSGGLIRANLTFPASGATRNLPLVVLPPGGAERADPRAFDRLAQFLAVRGYAVLQPQILRQGVRGPGQINGGMITWGGASKRYATDGVHFLVKQGVVDAKRVCIVGMGYGGYAALAGAAFSPHTYACAVSIDGIADLPAYLTAVHREFAGSRSAQEVRAYWRSEVGSPTDAKVIAESPLNAASQVLAPVLLLYTAKDSDVPVAQMQDMERALKKLGKPVSFIRLGADSSIYRPATRRKVLRAIDAFLGRVLH